MKILITGGCGFIGSNLAIYLKKELRNSTIVTLDNLYRRGSDLNKNRLKKFKVQNHKIDITDFRKISKLQKFDLVIDCCAEPAIEVSKKDITRVLDTNLYGTFNILKKCLKDKSKIIFLSSSRVYSIKSLRKLIGKTKLKSRISSKFKINEKFDTSSPKSLYGFSKLSSEELIKEFSFSNKIRFIINRLGVVSGPWQFGKQDQGFVSLWVAHHKKGKNLSYIGFGGNGCQVRDIIHIDDVCEIILKQIKLIAKKNNDIFNIGGGLKNAISLKELTTKCEDLTNNKIYFKKINITSNYDIPYFVTDNSKIQKFYNWKPKRTINNIINDIYYWLDENNNIEKKYF